MAHLSIDDDETQTYDLTLDAGQKPSEGHDETVNVTRHGESCTRRRLRDVCTVVNSTFSRRYRQSSTTPAE